MTKVLIEVCCASADDAVRAQAAGADRIELNSALFAGGLTPTVGMMRAVRERVDIPVICMLRPRPGGFAYSDLEFETMKADLQALQAAGADGFAAGCLTQAGLLDRERLSRLAALAGERVLVFHRAFDVMPTDPLETLAELKELGFRRVLTSGREKTALAGAGLIRKLVQANLLEVLPGGGIRPDNIAALLEKTGCSQAHFSFHATETDGSMRASRISFAGEVPADTQFSIIDQDGLSAFIRQIREL